MDQPTGSKKAVIYAAQFLATAVMYGVVMYILDQFFESGQRYTMRSILIQSVVFGALYTLLNAWITSRKRKKDKEG